MNILVTTSVFPRWRNDLVQPVVFNYVKNLSRFYPQINLTVLAPHHRGAKKEEFVDNIRIYRYKYFQEDLQTLCYDSGILSNLKKNFLNYLLLPFFLIAQLLAIRKIVRAQKIDIIHANWLIPQGLVAVVYRKIFNKKAKIICTIHGSDINSLNSLFWTIIKKFTIKNTNQIIAVSHDLKNKINQDNKTTVIPQGVDLKKFKPQPINQELKQKYNISHKCLLFVGRLVKSKGTEYLIKALPLIIKVYPDIKLLIIGSGPEKEKIEKLASKLSVRKNIKFLGYRENDQLPIFYNLADIIIGPSITEGFGIVFLESLACGTPVIASNVGGIKDIIKQDKTGILVKPKDWGMLAEQTINLLSDQEKQIKFGRAGQKFIQQFSWQNNIKRHLQIYQQIILKK